ncbi:MAG: hypothetical protein EYC70_00420 [Planctomycetota bacterium]|nr:MAG: hypothetical protein EYC70_00420 [Planctomycetota bacterium]
MDTARNSARLTLRAYARHRGCSHAWVSAAVRRGLLGDAVHIVEGRIWIDPEAADRHWPKSPQEGRRRAGPQSLASYRRRRRQPPSDALSLRGYARHRGCAPNAVHRAIVSGRIASAVTRDGRHVWINVEAADAAWDRNTDPAQRRGELPDPVTAVTPALDTSPPPPPLPADALRLAAAPWDLADAQLVLAAGPCTTCRKNSGNIPSLFDGPGHESICEDRGCWGRKMAAHQERLELEFEKQAAAQAPLPGQEPSPLQKAYSELKLEQGRMDLSLNQLKLASLAGRLVRSEAVARGYADGIGRLREAMLQLADRLSPLLAADTNPRSVHELLLAELRSVLRDVSRELQAA